MKSLLSQSVLSALLFGSYISAFPLESPSGLDQLAPRATAPSICSDFRRFDSSCWTTLQVADYLTSWNKTTPKCAKNGGNGSNCCTAGEPWSTCFLRLAIGSAGYSCDSLSPTFCTNPNVAVNDRLDPAIRFQARYVASAIFAIHLLFAGYDKGK